MNMSNYSWKSPGTVRAISKVTAAAMVLLASFALVSCGSDDEPVADNRTYLANAENYKESGQYQAAIIEARNAMQIAPDDLQGTLILAEIYIEIGQAKEAVKLLEEIDTMTADGLLLLADAYSKSGKLRSASDLLDGHATELSGRKEEVDLLRANLFLARNQLADAESVFQSVLDSDVENTDALLGLATIEASRGDVDAVKSILDSILKLDPGNTRALLFSSSLKYQEGDLAGSESLLMDAMASTPNTDIITPMRYSILVALRDNLTQQGKSSEALIYSGLLSESMPGVEEINVKFQEAMSALEKSDFDDAKTLLGEIQSQIPGSERAGTMLGVIEYLQGDNDAAVRQFEQFIDPETASSTALQLFAMAELKLNKPEKVLARLGLDIDNSTDGKLVALYGIAAVSSGDAVTGEKYLLKAVDLEPENGRLRFPLVQLYNRQDQAEQALAQVKTAFRKQPDDAIVQSGMIQQLILMGRVDEAANVVKGIRSSYPNSQASQLLVASFFLNQRNMEEAEEVLVKALTLGESERARLQLAGIYLAKKGYKNAEQGFVDVVKLNPESSDAYKGLITVYELQQRVEEGLSLVKKLAAENGASAPRLVLSEYYGRNGNFVDAFASLEGLDESQSQGAARLSETLFIAKANQQFRNGELDDSRKTIVEGLSHTPDSARLVALLVGVELGVGRIEEAEKVVRKLEGLVPNAPIVSILAGDVAIARDDVSGALELYRKAWDQAPSDQIAAKIYTSLTRQDSPDEEALVAFLEDWRTRLPTSQIAELTSAGYHMESGDMGSARKGYEAMLETNENVAVVHNNLAWIYGEKELTKAVAAGKKAYELAPERAEIIDTYAWFLYKSGDIGQAKTLMAKAIKLTPDNEEIRQHYEEISKQ